MKTKMENRFMLFFACATLLVLFLSACVAANRFYVPPTVEPASVVSGTTQEDHLPGAEISITTWNVGYAGMGKESDFVFDLGEQRRPLSKALVTKNLAIILEEINAFESDVILLQEVAKPSWSTYQQDVLGPISNTLNDYSYVFKADVDTRYVPPPYRVAIGNAIFSRNSIESAEWRALPLEPNFELGLFRKNYRMHVVRLPGDPGWTIINIHLSTFDDAQNKVRERQVEALFEFARTEFELGRHVIIGGDWNLRLAKTEFPHNTDDKYKFWIRDFPQDAIPDGWIWAVDPDTATVRTAHKPFSVGDNYTLIIDGFLVSPNVRVLQVTTKNLGFEASDHHPVNARFGAL